MKSWKDAEILEVKVNATAQANEAAADYDDWIIGEDGDKYLVHGDAYPSGNSQTIDVYL